MKVEIWSDVMCPFCYIGKRKFEAALNQFPNKDKVEVEWKSYQLNPDIKFVKGRDINTYLSEAKGISMARAKEMNAYVTGMAADAGLTFNLDISVLANTFDAHRFIHFAGTKGKQDAAKERLLKAYFEEAKNVGDADTLAALGTDIGLDGGEVKAMLASDQFEYEVKTDILEARNLGVTGVPFFVIDRKYGISGAQPAGTFLQALNQAWTESQPALTTIAGDDSATCTDEGCAV